MAEPTFLAQLDGDATFADTGAGGTGTWTGPARYRDGHTAGVEAAIIERAATNYAPNPHYLGPTEPYAAPTNNTNSIITDARAGNGKAYQVTWDGTGLPSIAVVDSSGSTHPSGVTAAYVAFDYWSDDASPQTYTVRVQPRYLDTTSFTDNVGDITPTSTPQRFEYVVTGIDPLKTLERIRVFTDENQASQMITARPTVELVGSGTTHVPEIDSGGTIVSGYSWTGTAHNSPSTRTASSLAFTIPAPEWVAARYSEDMGETWDVAILTTLTAGNLGASGSITHDGTDLIVESAESLLIGPLMAGIGVLTTADQTMLETETTWSMALPFEVPFTGSFVKLLVNGTRSDAPTIVV